MSDKKQNNITNFSRLLKQLENENVSVDELRALKQQHSYLQKLRQQRQKIEQLKDKYDDSQNENNLLRQQNKTINTLLEEYQHKNKQLENQLDQALRQKSAFQSGVLRQSQLQKQKIRLSIQSLIDECDSYKKELKQKNLEIFTLQNNYEEKIKSIRDNYQLEKKKMSYEVEEQRKKIEAQSSEIRDENTQLRNLVTRQHRALQVQNQQCEEVVAKNQLLRAENQSITEENQMCRNQCEELKEEIQIIRQKNMVLEITLQEHKNNNSNKDQICQLRKKVSQMAKGEIQRIEYIVNEFN